MQAGAAEVNLGKRRSNTLTLFCALDTGLIQIPLASVVLVPFGEPAPSDYHPYAA